MLTTENRRTQHACTQYVAWGKNGVKFTLMITRDRNVNVKNPNVKWVISTTASLIININNDHNAAFTSTDLLKHNFHWDQFPHNFPLANVTGKSPTSYEEVTRKLATFRPSRHVQMVWHVANFLVTSR